MTGPYRVVDRVHEGGWVFAHLELSTRGRGRPKTLLKNFGGRFILGPGELEDLLNQAYTLGYETARKETPQ